MLRGPLDRDSLHLAVVRLPAAQQRLAWLAEHLGELPGSGIIYTLTVAAAHETAAFLRDRGHDVAAYTGSDDHAERQAAEDALLANELKALVATSALGMGFDKPDLGFVVHLGAPQSPIAYYQQIGRAGRGVDRAEVILLPGREDADIWAYFALARLPAGAGRPRHARRAGRGGPAAVDRRAGDQGRPEPQPAGDDAQGPRRGRRGPPGQRRLGGDRPGVGVRRRPLRAGRAPSAPASSRRCSATSTADDCRMEYLRRELDDPAAAAVRALRQLHRAALAATRSPRPAPPPHGDRLLRPGVEITPRKMWPTGMKDLGIDVAGKIPAGPVGRAGPGPRPADRPGLGSPAARPAGRRRGR